MLQSGVQRLVRRFLLPGAGQTMGLVLGAAFCRFSRRGSDGILQEPSALYRQKSTGLIILQHRSIGEMTRNTLICKNTWDFELVPMLEGEAILDGYILASVLAYFRNGGIDSIKGLRPGRLAVTARPALLRAVRPLLPWAAREAGFWDWTIVEEIDCLAAQIGVDPDGVTLAVDAGHAEARVHVWRRGILAASEEVPEAGGIQLAATVLAGLRRQNNLHIGTLTAWKFLREYGTMKDEEVTLTGRDILTGMPRRWNDAPSLAKAVAPSYEKLAAACRRLIGTYSARPVRTVLVGNGASAGLEAFLRSRLPGAVERPPEPGSVSARGLGALIARRRAGDSHGGIPSLPIPPPGIMP